MAGLLSLADVITLAKMIHQMCQDAKDNRGALREAKLKVEVVTDILSELPPDAAKQEALQQVYVALTALHEAVSKMNQMKRFLYTRKAKECANEIRNQTGNLQFYMNSLQVSQTAAVFRKLLEMDNTLDAVEDETSLCKQLEHERKQQKELNALLRNPQDQALDAAELQRRGWIESPDEVRELVQQLIEERDRLVANHEKDKAAVKDRMEAEYLEQMIQLVELPPPLKSPSEQQLPPEVIESVLCPITSEVMKDPIIVDGINCKCCLSREAFQTWQSTSKSNVCPNCRGPLRSNRVSPNVGLAQVAAFVLTQQQQHHQQQQQQPTTNSPSLQPRASTSSSIPTSSPAIHIAPSAQSETQQTPQIQPMSMSVANSTSNNVASEPALDQVRLTVHQPTINAPVITTTTSTVSTVSSSESPLAFAAQGFHYKCKSVITGHTDTIYSCAGLDSSKVVSVSRDMTIRVWDIESGECLRVIVTRGSPLTCCDVLHDGEKIVVGSSHTLRVWDVETGQLFQKLSGHKDYVSCCTVLAGNGKVVSGSFDKTLKLWNADTGICLQTLEGHAAAVRCCASVYGGRKILSGSDDKTLIVWNSETGDCLQTLRGHIASVRCCIDLNGGSKVASVSSSGTLNVWNVEAGACLHSFKAHSNAFQSDIFCTSINGGTHVVSGSRGKKLKVWNVEKREFVEILEGHTGRLLCCVALEGGRTLVSGGADRTLRVWRQGAE